VNSRREIQRLRTEVGTYPLADVAVADEERLHEPATDPLTLVCGVDQEVLEVGWTPTYPTFREGYAQLLGR